MAVIYTATVDGKSYGFDFDDQRIDIDATINTLFVANLWIAIKEAMASLVGICFARIATGGGTDVLGTGVETFLTVTLLDNWEVSTLKVSGKFEVQGGNLIRDDQADPFRDNPSITYISFLSQAGIATHIETGISGLTPTESEQLANLGDTVWGTLIEAGFTASQVLKIIAASAAGKTSNGGKTFRDLSDTKDRITGTVTGADRTAATYDAS